MIETIFHAKNDDFAENNELIYTVIELPCGCNVIFPDDWHRKTAFRKRFNIQSDLLLTYYFAFLGASAELH